MHVAPLIDVVVGDSELNDEGEVGYADFIHNELIPRVFICYYSFSSLFSNKVTF